MLSDRDVRDLVGNPREFVAAWQLYPDAVSRVADAMREVAITVTEDRPVAELAELFAVHRLGAFPVVAADGVLVGIVSYVDVLRAFAVP
jgi:CBS domain-containing protein